MNDYLICMHCNFHNKIEDSEWVEDPLDPDYEDEEGDFWSGQRLYHCPNCNNDAVGCDGFPSETVSDHFRSIEYFYKSWQLRKHERIRHIAKYYNKKKGGDLLTPEELTVSFTKLTAKFEAPQDIILSNPANGERMLYFKELLPTIDMDILSQSVFNLEPWEVYEEEAFIVIMAVSIFETLIKECYVIQTRALTRILKRDREHHEQDISKVLKRIPAGEVLKLFKGRFSIPFDDILQILDHKDFVSTWNEIRTVRNSLVHEMIDNPFNTPYGIAEKAYTFVSELVDIFAEIHNTYFLRSHLTASVSSDA